MPPSAWDRILMVPWPKSPGEGPGAVMDHATPQPCLPTLHLGGGGGSLFPSDSPPSLLQLLRRPGGRMHGASGGQHRARPHPLQPPHSWAGFAQPPLRQFPPSEKCRSPLLRVGLLQGPVQEMQAALGFPKKLHPGAPAPYAHQPSRFSFHAQAELLTHRVAGGSPSASPAGAVGQDQAFPENQMLLLAGAFLGAPGFKQRALPFSIPGAGAGDLLAPGPGLRPPTRPPAPVPGSALFLEQRGPEGG